MKTQTTTGPADAAAADDRTGPVRIGMLTPSSNTVLEPATATLVAPIGDVASVHFGRFRVTQIKLDAASNTQFEDGPILAAADLLADAKPHVIAWNGPSASWLGFKSDERLCGLVRDRTGVRATSAILGLNALLKIFGVRRLGLVTPYTSAVQERIAANYAKAGMEIAGEAHSGLTDNFSFSRIAEAEVDRMCREVAAARPDAIAVVCTNMRGPFVAARIEREIGIPVFDSISVTLWSALRLAGIDTTPLAGFGRLFAAVDRGDAPSASGGA